MNKQQFLKALRKRLSTLPRAELEERLRFYSEMIEDRMEEGLSEAEAVAAVGSAAEIAAQILGEDPRPVCKPGKKGWEITLLILGFPLWFPLLVAAFAVGLSLYVSLWAVIISLWAVFAALAVCALAFFDRRHSFGLLGHDFLGHRFGWRFPGLCGIVHFPILRL